MGRLIFNLSLIERKAGILPTPATIVPQAVAVQIAARRPDQEKMEC